MSRWVYRDDGKGGVAVTEVGADYSSTPTSTGDLGKFAYDGLRAPDGTDISSRAKHAAYLKANGLSMLTDFKNHSVKMQAERERVFTPGAGFDSKERKQDVANAIQRLEARSKK